MLLPVPSPPNLRIHGCLAVLPPSTHSCEEENMHLGFVHDGRPKILTVLLTTCEMIAVVFQNMLL